MIKKEIHSFFTALMFYTRIPCPSWVDHKADMLNKATKYFPVIGWIIGGTAIVIFYITQLILPNEIAVMLSMISTVFITGAFHEDALADVSDGFGGGWTKERILQIMKDSSIGAYGTIAVCLALLLKYVTLNSIADQYLIKGFFVASILGHSLSRTTAVWLIYADNYVRENDDAKAKPIAKQLPLPSLITATSLGFLPLVLFHKIWLFILVIPMFLSKTYFSYYFKKWIGGYTGDCLGTVQQVSEILIYLSLMIIWRYTL